MKKLILLLSLLPISQATAKDDNFKDERLQTIYKRLTEELYSTVIDEKIAFLRYRSDRKKMPEHSLELEQSDINWAYFIRKYWIIHDFQSYLYKVQNENDPIESLQNIMLKDINASQSCCNILAHTPFEYNDKKLKQPEIVDLKSQQLKEEMLNIVQNICLNINQDSTQSRKFPSLSFEKMEKRIISLRYKADSNLNHLDLSGRDLSGIDFSHLKLKGTSFKGANLSDANLFKAHLTDADFTEANMENAEISCTKRDGTIFTGAIWPNGYKDMSYWMNKRIKKLNDELEIPHKEDVPKIMEAFKDYYVKGKITKEEYEKQFKLYWNGSKEKQAVKKELNKL